MSDEPDSPQKVESALARAREAADLNAFVSLAGDDRQTQMPAPNGDHSAHAKRPLAGIPIAVKDSIDVAGYPCTGGTPALREWRPSVDAGVVRVLHDAGAVVIGKTNMHELSAGVTSNNATFGPVRNPYDGRLIAGGSSGGSAAAVASGVVTIALGADTAGSCRIPASLCGCVGFRPTTGRYPTDGVIPLSFTRDVVGTLTRTVEDAMLLDELITGQRPRPVDFAARRLGVPRPYFYDDLDAQTRPVIDRALDRLAGAGAVLVETEIQGLEDLTGPVSLDLTLSEWPRDLGTYLGRHRCEVRLVDIVDAMAGHVEQAWLANELWGRPVPHGRYVEIVSRTRPAVAERYRDCFARDSLDALVLPTTRLPARPIGQDETVLVNGSPVKTLDAYLRNTDPTAFAGLPSISVPAGLTESGLPVGLSIDGLPGMDQMLLGLAAAFQRLGPPLPSPTDPLPSSPG